MSWAVGYDTTWSRDVGYGVPATCDHPDCGARIDRGLGYVCGGQPYGGEAGCGLYFCGQHLQHGPDGPQCERCTAGEPPFDPTPDIPEWVDHKLTHPSWGRWRVNHAAEVAALRQRSETDRDRRFFDLRDSGYDGPIDQDGYPAHVEGTGLNARIVRD